MAEDQEGIPAMRLPVDVEGDERFVLLAALVGDGDHRLEQADHVDGLRIGAGELRIEARGVRDVADQPVEALHVMLDDG